MTTRSFPSGNAVITVFEAEGQSPKLHNWDGPAIEYPNGDGRNVYAIFGQEMTKDEWIEFRQDRIGLPWYLNNSMKNKLSNVQGV